MPDIDYIVYVRNMLRSYSEKVPTTCGLFKDMATWRLEEELKQEVPITRASLVRSFYEQADKLQ